MTSIYPSSTSGSTNSSTSSKNLLRISGMASGIDTDSVVKSMVSNYQAKIDKASQAKQTLQWKQEAYRTIIKDVKGLQDYFDPLSSKYILSSNALNVNTTASSDTAVLTASAGADVKAGTYKVAVSQLAEQAKAEGSAKNSLVKLDTTTDTKIATNWQGKTLKFSAGSITISNSITDLNGDAKITADELVADINKQISNSSDLKGKISASYVNDGSNSYIKFTNLTSDAVTIKESDNSSISDITSTLGAGKTMSINSGISSSSKLTDLGFTTGTISFALNSDTNNITLPVDSSTTLKDLMNKVNSATNGVVTVNIDDTTGKISFQSNKYGSTSSVKITDTNGANNVLTTLGISTDTTVTKTGKDAIVAITAPNQTSAITTTQTSNKFTINGVNYNLVKTGDANVTVTANTDTVVNNFKNFIKDYNSVISEINTKLSEKKNSDYPPLTDAQKESMSEDQITTWEAKAKVGILRNDDFLNNMMTELRGVFSSPVYNNYDSSNINEGIISLSFGQYGSNAVGLDTSSKIADSGKLVLQNEAKFKNAIENNFEDFKKMFIGASDTKLGTDENYIGSKKYKEDGLLTRMDQILRDYVAQPGLGEDGTYTLSGKMNMFVNKQYDYGVSGASSKNTLPDQVYNKTVLIANLNKQMSAAETRYYNKFTALETAMSKLNSQQSSLSSMLGTS
ncbi:flagellar filament capping protein FliD [Clostridium beijerinckii]|uniref:flagellar filament capping protein FliD n=1 Tax=Clostridium beijerinckii TaxID=1520 RepID=UPI000809D6B9|nr:flagellar filament capping protein FliD [Clostridium beijerinckii]OCA96806.1 hypothetical protein BGS1_06005 [Clostridium beijerinckii]